jgi:hypothetical protein
MTIEEAAELGDDPEVLAAHLEGDPQAQRVGGRRARSRAARGRDGLVQDWQRCAKAIIKKPGVPNLCISLT